MQNTIETFDRHALYLHLGYVDEVREGITKYIPFCYSFFLAFVRLLPSSQ